MNLSAGKTGMDDEGGKMQYCPKCQIKIRGNKNRCPLCEGPLTGEPEARVFPAAKKRTLTAMLIIRISTFVLLAFEIAMAATGYLAVSEAKHTLAWIPVVMIGAAVLWLDLVLAIHLRNNVIKIVTAEAYFAMVIDVVVDVRTGYIGWSVAWMIPVTFAGLAIATVATAAGVKMRLEDYAVYLLVDTVFCMFQLFPLFLHLNFFEWPAVICMAAYLVFISAILTFRRRDMKNAAAKYFNV